MISRAEPRFTGALYHRLLDFQTDQYQAYVLFFDWKPASETPSMQRFGSTTSAPTCTSRLKENLLRRNDLGGSAHAIMRMIGGSALKQSDSIDFLTMSS